MKNSALTISLCILISFSAFSQGTDGALIDPNNATTRDASAVFQSQSTTQGMLTPRMTAAQRTAIPVSAARDGLLVYQTDGTPGFYYYNGTAWVLISNTTSNLAGVTAGTGLTGGGTSGTITVNAVGDNGLTTNADDIDLGGNLTQAATTITQDGSETFTIANTGTGNTTINLTSTGDFDVQDNGTSALFVRDDGFVGVGTNAPSQKLHINGGDIQLNDAAGVAGYRIKSYSTGSSLWLLSGNTTDSKLVLSTSAHDWDRQVSLSYTPGTTGLAAGNLIIGQIDKNNVNWTHGITQFYTNGTERIRIASDGNVGIGTPGPQSKLHVEAGKIYSSKTTFPNPAAYTNADLVLGSNTDTRGGYTGTNGSHIFLRSSDKSSITALDEGNNLGQLSFQNLVWTIGEDIGWGTQVIKAPNLAGAGTRFVVADASGNLSATSSTSSGVVTGSGTLNYIPKWTPNGSTLGNSLIYDNGTNVGIGTAGPGGKLEVVGGPITLSDGYLDINRDAYAKNGISWYSQGYPSWSTYMSPGGATSTGPHGDLTAPSGTYVTSWAMRDYIENAGGYGWTFESAANTTTPSVKFEIRASDGLFHSYGTGIIDGNLTVGGAVTSIGGYSPANSAIRLTPNLHLNATQNNAVIINWDNGATAAGTQMLRIGNGSSADMFGVLANGDVTIQNKVALRGNDSWLRLNQDAGFASGTYTPGFIRADGGIASGGLGSAGGGTITANSFINSNAGFRVSSAAAGGNYLRGDGTNFVSSAIQPGDLPSHTHTWAQVTAKPAVWLDGATLIADNGNFNNSVPSGFYQSSGATNAPGGSWYNMINVRHSNTGNDHGFQIAMSYYDEYEYTRTYQGGNGSGGGTFTPWAKHLTNRPGDWELSSNSTSTGYGGATLELRESNYTNNGSATPPHLGFHWGGVVASNISIESNGTIAIRDNPGTGYEKFKAGQITSTPLAGTGNRAVYADANGVLKTNGKNVAYVVDRGLRSFGNCSGGCSGAVTASASTGNLAVEVGDIIVITTSFQFRFTGGSGNDDMFAILQITGCATTSQQNSYYQQNWDNDRNELQPQSQQWVYVATCAGNLQFYLQVNAEANADDGYDTADVVITATRY